MTKQLIIGLATIAITGSALIATGMYATNTGTSVFPQKGMQKFMNDELINSLSGKISTGALQELQALTAKHKTELDNLAKDTNATIESKKALHETFKTELDSLMVKYPEIKTALPVFSKNNKGGKNNEVESIMSALPAAVQQEISSIRESYKSKQDTLRSEEKSKIDTILSAYPEIKTKLENLKPSEEMRQGRGKGMMNH